MLNRNVQVSRHGAYFGGIHSSLLMDLLDIFAFRYNCAFWNRSKLPEIFRNCIELFWNFTGGWHCDNLPVVGSGSQAAGEKKYFERKSLVAVLVLFNVHLFCPGKKNYPPLTCVLLLPLSGQSSSRCQFPPFRPSVSGVRPEDQPRSILLHVTSYCPSHLIFLSFV